MTLEIAIDMFLVTKQCQLNLNFETKKDTGTIDIFDYQTANTGTSPPPTPPFSSRRSKPEVFIWKKTKQ